VFLQLLRTAALLCGVLMNVNQKNIEEEENKCKTKETWETTCANTTKGRKREVPTKGKQKPIQKEEEIPWSETQETGISKETYFQWCQHG